MDIDKINRNFELMKKYRLIASFSLKAVKTSNVCIPKFNHTPEGNFFNLARETLYSRAIIDLRKILEPSSVDKTANLCYLIHEVIQNKEYFAQKHYEDDLQIPTTYIGEEENKPSDDFLKCHWESNANDEKEHCLETINLLERRWEKFWDLLTNNTSFSFIRSKRDLLVHSLDATEIVMPPIDKVQKLLNLTTWFIKKLDYIIFNTGYSYSSLDKQAEEISESFWNKL